MRRYLWPAIIVAAIVFGVAWAHGLQGWLAIHTGTDNEPGPYYGFFSGFGSDLSELLLLGGIIGLLRKHNCHVHGCWRIGRLPVEGTPFVVCRRHHPNGDVTLKDIRDRYHLYLGKQRGRG